MSALNLTLPNSQGPAARRSLRQAILFARVDCGGVSGVVLNLSEGGLCLQCERRLPHDGPVQLRFPKRHAEGWVEAQGRVVWRSEKDLQAGLSFVDLPARALEEVRQWLDFGARLEQLRSQWTSSAPVHRGIPHWLDLLAATPPLNAAGKVQTSAANESRRKNAAALSDPATATAEPRAATLAERFGRVAPALLSPANRARKIETSSLVWMAALLTLLMAASILGSGPLRSESGRVHFRQAVSAAWVRLWPRPAAPMARAPEQTTMPHAAATVIPQSPEVPDLRADIAAIPAPSEPAPAFAAAPAPAFSVVSESAASGWLLQVGALRSAANAQQLVRTLQQQSFPVFIYQKNASDLYKVLVGPFANPQALAAAKAALRHDGLQAIPRQTPR